MNEVTNIFKYWLTIIIIPSLLESINITKVGGKLIELVLSAMISIMIVLGLGLSGKIPDSTMIIGFLLWILFTFLLRFTFNLFYFPAKLYEEQSITIDQFNQGTKAKLELYYDPNHKSSKQVDYSTSGNSANTFRIFIKNVSLSSVEGFRASIVSITPNEYFTFLPAELGIMNNQEKRLNAGDSLCLDAIYLELTRDPTGELKYKFHFGFENQDLIRRSLSNNLKAYEFTIVASGSNCPQIQKTFEFVVTNEGRDPHFDIREKQ